MFEFILLYLFLISIVFVQSILGVGVLIIGTPVFLIFDFSILEIMKTLLPISILTSAINILIILKRKNFQKIELSKSVKKSFFLICVPSIFLGLYVLKTFESFLNFSLIVSCIIFLSVFIKLYQKKIWIFFKNQFLLRITMFFIGIIHGITNSGGTLLMLFFTKSVKGMITNNRYNISFFYFFLALFQYLVFANMFKGLMEFHLYDLIILSSVLLGVLLGNLSIRFINEDIIDKTIVFTSLVSAISLLIKL